MKKEDFTTRLLKLFFHIQGPFDECRQEMIYKACARALIQIVYSSLLLFLFYLLFGRFIELVRDAMPYLYFGLIFVLASRARLAVHNLHFDKDDPSEIHHKRYSKSQIKVRSWGVFLSIQLGLFLLLIFHKLFVQHLPLDTFWDNLSQFDKTLPLLVLGLGIGAIFGTMTYAFLSEHEMKHSESGMHKENIEK
ncbi:DUF3278 domain-containing protein [Streptococcus oralis]|jgi:hypothetical protein|uniref:DUF3278 domain-containing protein n=1 Tax=Streptococcus oralis subsp. dentisani TaxID=1458253 RepID=A0A428FXC7_STROR|nr:DUF3278 domain-containing protein [Streptococcus oralis]MBZ2085539.1 DUF3278 domain-containing protein [Streptococcus oralis]MBZ2089027.1 DUF3278 domain-containing protein [Streptococcus oralis]RSJ67320.1 hypothetical protein D8805_07505 [Streptococcus oralis subsp. dentisani]